MANRVIALVLFHRNGNRATLVLDSRDDHLLEDTQAPDGSRQPRLQIAYRRFFPAHPTNAVVTVE
jgi:hypothetical protein